MAIYVKVMAMARVKIQDPYDEKTIEELKENLRLTCPEHELINEIYDVETDDAD